MLPYGCTCYGECDVAVEVGIYLEVTIGRSLVLRFTLEYLLI